MDFCSVIYLLNMAEQQSIKVKTFVFYESYHLKISISINNADENNVPADSY